MLIVDEHQNQPCHVDPDHRDQKASGDAKLAWMKEGNEDNYDVFKDNYSVYEK